MRRSGLLIIILIIAILVILSPWFAGMAFKHNFYKLADAINQNPNSPINAEILSYNRGYLTSYAQVRLSVSPQFQATLKTPLQNNSLIINETIKHGPIVTNSVTNRKTLAYGNIQSDINPPLEPGMTGGNIRINTLCKIGNKWENTLSMPTFTYTDASSKIILQNITSILNFKLRHNQIDSLDFNLAVALINAQNNAPNSPFAFELNNFKTDFQGNLASSGLWNSERSMRFDRVLVKLSDGSNVLLSNFNSTGESQDKTASDNQHTYTVKTEFSLDQLTTPSKVFPTLGPINYTFAINNMSSQALKDLLDLIKQQKNNMSTTADYKLMTQYLSVALGTIRPDTTIESQSLVKTPQGDFTFNINISWPAMKFNNFYDVLMGANFDLNLSAGVNLVNNTIDEVARLSGNSTMTTPATTTNTTTSSTTTTPTTSSETPETATNTAAPLETQTPATQTTSTSTSPTGNLETSTAPTVTPLEANTANTTTTSSTQTTTSPTPTQTVLTPQEKAAQAKAFITKLTNEGYITIKDNNYIMNIKRANGELTINGKPMPLPRMPMTTPGPTIPAPAGGTSASN